MRNFRSFDISVKADKKRRSTRQHSSVFSAEKHRKCQWDFCNSRGHHRAPASTGNAPEYYWFCLKHIREYNRNWNYFDKTHEFWEDNIWERPTWSANTHNKEGGSFRNGWDNVHADGMFWKRYNFSPPPESENVRKDNVAVCQYKYARYPGNIQKALRILDVSPDANLSSIKEQYRELVKLYHPDMNDGKRIHEEQLCLILWAWKQISESSKLFE